MGGSPRPAFQRPPAFRRLPLRGRVYTVAPVAQITSRIQAIAGSVSRSFR